MFPMNKSPFSGRGAFVTALALIFTSSAMAQFNCLNTFSNQQHKYLHNTARAASDPFTLIPGPPLGAISYKVGEETFALEEYLTKFCVTGFLVMKEDKIVFERYLQGHKASDTLFSASMSKTIFALLVGIAVGQGKLSLQDRVVTVLPDFQDSAFADATVENLLRMSSGVVLVDSYERDNKGDNQATNPMISPRQNVRSFLRDKRDRTGPHGKVFSYNGVQTAMLAQMLSERLGTNLTSYLENQLWQPMGAEMPGYWIKNWRGEEGAQGQFNASLRDYARLGYLMMNQGRIGEKQLVPAEWIVQMTELRRDEPQPKTLPHYGLHVWIPQAAEGRSTFNGVNGQFIFVDPVARVVIVHTGNSPQAAFHGNAHVFPLRNAIVKQLARERTLK